MEMDDVDREFIRVHKYFRKSRRMQRHYEEGNLAGPDAVTHLAIALLISRRNAWRHLKMLEQDLDRAAARRRQYVEDIDEVEEVEVTPAESRSGLGYVAASAAAAIGGLVLGILSGYKGKYK